MGHFDLFLPCFNFNAFVFTIMIYEIYSGYGRNTFLVSISTTDLTARSIGNASVATWRTRKYPQYVDFRLELFSAIYFVFTSFT